MSQTCFVIMPFTESPTRNAKQLSGFFETALKNNIEKSEELTPKIEVTRSDDTLNITNAIMKSIFEADYLIADLSGLNANPNVMYELGVRLGGTNKPVILVRESHEKNRDIFDITNLHTFYYDPVDTSDLQKYVIRKLKSFQSKKEFYISPVLEVIGKNISFGDEIKIRRFKYLMRSCQRSAFALTRHILGKMFVLMKEKEESEQVIGKCFNGKITENSLHTYEHVYSNIEQYQNEKLRLNIYSIGALERLLEDIEILNFMGEELAHHVYEYLDYYHFRHLAGNELIGDVDIFVALDFLVDTNNFISTISDYIEQIPNNLHDESMLNDALGEVQARRTAMKGQAANASEQGEGQAS